MPIKKYGLSFPDNFTPLLIELGCWRNYNSIKNPQLELWEHLRNAALLCIPGLQDNYNPWFERQCQAYAYNSYLAGIGCSSSGKTYGFHTLAFVDFMSDPRHTQGIFTTTSASGLKTRMWPILSAHFRAIRPAGWKITSAPNMTIRSDRDDPKHSLRGVILAPKADKSEITDNIIGAHTDRVIWIVDEATSSPDAIFQAWSNLKGATSHRRFILLGNPDDQLDTLGRFCRPCAGWDSVSVETEEWNFEFEGEQGLALHFDGLKSPNLSVQPKDTRAGPVSRWPFLFGHADAATHEKNKEVNPLAYWRFCRGWYADASIVPKVMTMTEIDIAGSRNKTVFYGGTKNFASLDPAYGGDRAMLKVWKMGDCSESTRKVMEQIGNFEIPIHPNTIKGRAIGEFVMEKAKEMHFDTVGIDTTTDNSAPAEYLRLNSDLEIIDVNFGGRPSSDPVSPSDTTPCDEKYDRKVTELWFTVKHLLNQIRGLDEETCIELCTRYFFRKGRPEKLCVETKREMKERAHGKSPDCFVAGTQILTSKGAKPIQEIKIGDLIKTPYGFSSVAMVHKTQTSLLTTLELSDGRKLTGKGRHKIFTWDAGWKRMDSITIANAIEPSTMLSVWNILNQYFIKKNAFGFKKQADIIHPDVTAKTGRKDFYTGGFGLIILDLSLRGLIFITKTEIGQTMLSITWNLPILLSTYVTTWLRDLKIHILLRKIRSIFTEPNSLPKSGIVPQKGLNGIESMPSIRFGKTKSRSVVFAKTAGLPIRQSIKDEPFFAQTNACRRRQELETGKTGFALFVHLFSEFINTKRPPLAVLNVEVSEQKKPVWVYNLTLDSDNVYYANGILVQNCADCVTIGVAVFRKLGGFDLPVPPSKTSTWNKIALRRNSVYSSEGAYT